MSSGVGTGRAQARRRTAGYVDESYLRDSAIAGAIVKARIRELVAPFPGARVLDLGCGPATDTHALATASAPNGFTVGCDLDLDFLRQGSRNAVTGSDAVVNLVQGSGFALPFRTASFDAAVCDKLIQHLANPMPVVTEMVRVVRPGGRVVLADNDWNTLSFSTAENQSERRLVAEVQRYGINKDAGRDLLALLHRAGLESITTEGRALILRSLALARRFLLVDLDDILEQWSAHEPDVRQAFDVLWADLERREAEGTFFASVTRIIAVGQRV